MDNLPDGLRERVLRLNADLLVDLLRPDEAVWLACDLLVAGVETPTLLEFAGESPTRLTSADAAPLVRQVLAELGVEPIDASQAPWIVARDIARQIIAGSLLPEDGARSLWGLWWSCDTAQEIGLMLPNPWKPGMTRSQRTATTRRSGLRCGNLPKGSSTPPTRGLRLVG